ncbi:flagellar type III secretion system pore protein FliP [Buchnera aphidicola]|uniref:flagellar type III secretion system pore protein FliP n=1 Tax=Buchnera aphidicola TaxID=9 RepID=UPI0030EE2458
MNRLLIIFFFFFSHFSYSQELLPSKNNEIFSSISNFLSNNNNLSISIPTLIFTLLLTFIPIIILMTTAFTRIIIVFSLLRNALGTPYSPPNQVLIGLSLFLTFFVMNPTLNTIYKNSYVPYIKKEIVFSDALQEGIIPLKKFMFSQTRKSDLMLFSKFAHVNNSKNFNDVPLMVLIPSFITSELTTAFKIGFTIFVPFLIIDLIVASILMSLGMMMIPPSTISLPFKIMIFVLSDGWKLLINSLIKSFYY